MDTTLVANAGIAVIALRVACGLFFLPHILFKVAAPGKAIEFFTKAGFAPAGVYVVLAGVVETLCAIGLIFGIYPALAAALAAILLGVAAGAVLVVSGPGWNWIFGGVEYPVFWASVSAIVAVLYW